jgi:hypothetical protein
MPPDEGATATWHVFGQVAWEPDGSAVVLQANRLSWVTASQSDPTLLEQRVLVVETSSGAVTQIEPAAVRDLSVDVWAP